MAGCGEPRGFGAAVGDLEVGRLKGQPESTNQADCDGIGELDCGGIGELDWSGSDFGGLGVLETGN